jgi:hypothetical protein
MEGFRKIKIDRYYYTKQQQNITYSSVSFIQKVMSIPEYNYIIFFPKFGSSVTKKEYINFKEISRIHKKVRSNTNHIYPKKSGIQE